MTQQEISTSNLKYFTTEPKLRRFTKHGAFISSNRAKEFMEHLWQVGLKKCSYETLEWEFIQYFGSNDKRTVERYLGRPEKVERNTGLSKVVRMNRTSGKIAQFEYYNERHTQARQGLLETLGYISRIKENRETRFIIHHERMPYYTTQTTLEETQETANILQEFNECSELSKDDLHVCKLEEEGKHNEPILQGKECEKTVLEVVSPNQMETKERIEKEEEVIECTHTNLECHIQNCIQKEWIKEVQEFFTKIQNIPEKNSNQILLSEAEKVE